MIPTEDLQQRLLQVSDAPDRSGRMAGIVFARGLSSQDILEAMVVVGEHGQVSAHDAICAVVAGKILKLGIQNGSQVVFPTSGVIHRTLKSTPNMDGTLFELFDRLKSAAGNAARIEEGMKLGDRATQCAGGFWVGNISRVMGDEERRGYVSRMAQMGYTAALDSAGLSPELSAAQRAQAIVPSLIENFEGVVRVLVSFTEPEVDRMRLLM